MAEIWTCRVCGEMADDSNSADCHFCQQRYHLRLREDSDDRDCGQVWINPEHLALEFGCAICLGEAGFAQAANEPPLGDLH